MQITTHLKTTIHMLSYLFFALSPFWFFISIWITLEFFAWFFYTKEEPSHLRSYKYPINHITPLSYLIWSRDDW